MKYRVDVIANDGHFLTKSFRTNLMANLFINKILDEYNMTILDCEKHDNTLSYLCDGVNRVELVRL